MNFTNNARTPRRRVRTGITSFDAHISPPYFLLTTTFSLRVDCPRSFCSYVYRLCDCVAPLCPHTSSPVLCRAPRIVTGELRRAILQLPSKFRPLKSNQGNKSFPRRPARIKHPAILHSDNCRSSSRYCLHRGRYLVVNLWLPKTAIWRCRSFTSSYPV